MTSPFILVDGSSYFYRAFHALPPLTNSKGQSTGAIYGVVNMIKRLIKDYSPTRFAVIFDAPGKTFRDEWYPAYKATRSPTPPELRSQFQPLIAVLKAMGIPMIIMDGVEADDVIGTLAHAATEQSMPVLISTGDKDMAQLVNEHVELINTMTNQRLNEAGVRDKFGVSPQQIIDYLTLVGDTSDNIPGVPKCGPKTAVKWLTHYQTLDNLIHCADEIDGKIGESLRASLPHLELSKRLVTIKLDLLLPTPLDALVLQPIDHDALLTLAQELEFKGWIKELSLNNTNTPTNTAPSTAPSEAVIINNPTAFAQCLVQCAAAPSLCVYLKTEQNHLVGIALATAPNHSVYIPFSTINEPSWLSCVSVLNALKPILENPQIQKIGHDLKRDYTLLKRHEITLTGLAFDTMLESYLLNSTLRRHDLSTLLSMNNLPEKSIEAPASLLFTLHNHLYQQLSDPLRNVLNTIEMPLVSILANMERHGVLIDATQLAQQGTRLHLQIQALEEEAYQLAGRTFNLNSPKQLLDVLYHEQHLPILARTPKGQPSTGESVLQELAALYRLPAVILEYRSLSKLVSTYIDALPKHMDVHTQRVHTSYNQAVTATGRLSSSDPNLQNIPIRHPEGRLIRRAFIAPPGTRLLTADYSQIELRIMAHLSQDPQLQLAFANGWDIHSATASELFSIALSEVSTEQRRRAKAVNFGLIYGMSAFGLAKQLGIERHDAQHYMNRYFERYPGVQAFMEQTRQQAHDQGYVETIFGRRLYVPEINAHNAIRRKAAERMAINAPLQGSAADLIKKAMINVATWLNTKENPPACMIMQVHDELVFEVQIDAMESVQQTIRKLMEHAITLSVPLCVSIGTGNDWDSAH
jgi:DNA polymerase-1